MTKTKAIEDSIKHWARMIRWVGKEGGEKIVNEQHMISGIEESWFAQGCALCKKYNSTFNSGCSYCPLNKIGENCSSIDSLWKNVQHSENWKEWVSYAKVMLKTLKSFRR